jgi:hypothetical protein
MTGQEYMTLLVFLIWIFNTTVLRLQESVFRSMAATLNFTNTCTKKRAVYWIDDGVNDGLTEGH